MIKRLTESQLNVLAKMQKLIDNYNKLPRSERNDYFDEVDSNYQEYILYDSNYNKNESTSYKIIAEVLPEWCSHLEEINQNYNVFLRDYYKVKLPSNPFKTNLELRIVVYNLNWMMTSEYSLDNFMEYMKEHR